MIVGFVYLGDKQQQQHLGDKHQQHLGDKQHQQHRIGSGVEFPPIIAPFKQIKVFNDTINTREAEAKYKKEMGAQLSQIQQ